ncbi:hypothetical protein EJB05_15756, partial [Eragrostis curvula]
MLEASALHDSSHLLPAAFTALEKQSQKRKGKKKKHAPPHHRCLLRRGGDLGLAHTRPALRDLNALLAPEAFLLDATYALGAAALRVRPSLGRDWRQLQLCTIRHQRSLAELQLNIYPIKHGPSDQESRCNSLSSDIKGA